MAEVKLVPQRAVFVRPTHATDAKLRLDYLAFRRRHDARSTRRRHVGYYRILRRDAADVIVEENRVSPVRNQAAGVQLKLFRVGNTDQL